MANQTSMAPEQASDEARHGKGRLGLHELHLFLRHLATFGWFWRRKSQVQRLCDQRPPTTNQRSSAANGRSDTALRWTSQSLDTGSEALYPCQLGNIVLLSGFAISRLHHLRYARKAHFAPTLCIDR